MKANEMVTMDWVMPLQKRFRGIPGQVVTIDGGTDTCWIDCDDYSCLIPCGDVEGIPITPEILEKNGFEEFDGWRILDMDDVEIRWIGTILEISGSHGNMELPNVQCVHELQHALNLCRIDKEIII